MTRKLMSTEHCIKSEKIYLSGAIPEGDMTGNSSHDSFLAFFGVFKQSAIFVGVFSEGVVPLLPADQDDAGTEPVLTGLCRSQKTVRRGGRAREQLPTPRDISKRK